MSWIFFRFLSENQEYFNFFNFRSIVDEPKETQLNDERLRAHGKAVMTLIGEAIWYSFRSFVFMRFCQILKKRKAKLGTSAKYFMIFYRLRTLQNMCKFFLTL